MENAVFSSALLFFLKHYLNKYLFKLTPKVFIEEKMEITVEDAGDF